MTTLAPESPPRMLTSALPEWTQRVTSRVTELARAAPIELAERGLAPDAAIRAAIRRMCAQRIAHEESLGIEQQREEREAWLSELRSSPIAIATSAANDQHYELPPELFELALGPRMKYSSAYWPEGVTTLAAAEEAMLEQYCERAELRNGQRVLDLGCGWGSLTLYLAARYPDSHILAVSNSAGQRRFIERRVAESGLRNVEVVTADVNDFAPPGRFDRVLSVEMLEHVRNYEQLFARIRSWLLPDGKLFVHIFTHREYSYPFDADDPDDWMARHFFTGGMMPADDLFARFQDDLRIARQWRFSGAHYARTARAWLNRFDGNREAALGVLSREKGAADAPRWVQRWRIFFMACEELWGYRGGSEWLVSHYLMTPR